MATEAPGNHEIDEISLPDTKKRSREPARTLKALEFQTGSGLLAVPYTKGGFSKGSLAVNQC